MVTGYAMTCTVCESCYTDVNGWNQHLVESEHQHKSKLAFLEWDEDIRKCALVLYASFSVKDVSTALAVVKRFSEGTTLVTDFVSSSCKPRVVILQFESREKVHQVLATGHSQQIENQLIQLRGLEDFLELEWVELLSSFLGSNVTYRMPDYEIVAPERVPGPMYSLSNQKVEEFNKYGVGSLVSEVNLILNGRTIPDNEFNTVMETLTEITQLLRQLTKLELKVSLYRQNYLKLRNNVVSNTYLAFIYYYDDDGKNGFATPPSIFKLLKENLNPRSKRRSSHLRHITNFENDIANTFELGHFIQHDELPTTKIKLLTGISRAMAEVQQSRLVRFYCQFDPRVKILLGLLYHWAALNKITLVSDKVSPCGAFHMGPCSVSLEWMLLFFLCSQEKIIATPVEITKHPHNKHLRVKQKLKEIVDVGFDDNPGFITEWKRNKSLDSTFSEGQLALSVVQIFQKFMAFCSDEMSRSCVINTHEGELTLLENPGKSRDRHRYSNVIRSLHESREKVLIMEHPMCRRWKFSVNSNNWFNLIIPAMRETARKIGNLLQDFNSSLKTSTSNLARGGSDKLQNALLVNS